MAPSPQGTKRLSDTDVKEIFASLYEYGRRPPPHLQFQIVPVGPNGLKLSPPSHEFEDGLYVLLRPLSKKKNMPIPRAPPHLQDLLLPAPMPENCAWSLSGPQFPVSNRAGSLQQRYCYPKGRPEYSSYKGGALWTIRGHDGKEENEFRLLHVYRSHKRAANKGVALDPAGDEDGDTPPASGGDYPPYSSPAKKARYISPAREQLLLSSPRFKNPFRDAIHRIDCSASVETELSFPTLEHGFSHSFESVQPGGPGSNQPGAGDALEGHEDPPPHPHHRGSPPRGPPLPQRFPEHHLHPDLPFHDLQHDPYAHDPGLRSNEARFVQRLDVVHEKIRQYIFSQPEHLQAGLVSTLAAWARALAVDPLWTRDQAKATDVVHDRYGNEIVYHAC